MMTTEEIPRVEETVGIQSSKDDQVDLNAVIKEELRLRTEERDQLKIRLKLIETECAVYRKSTEPAAVVQSKVACVQLQAPSPVKTELEMEENQQLRDIIGNMKILVKDKTTACSRYVLQIQALETQVAALKEVTCLTKGMLNIRNTENEKLKEQIDLMQKKVDSERVRNNAVLKKTELAGSLNIQLRTEYQNQVKLIGELRQKYEQKINILTGEVARLHKEQQQQQQQQQQPLTNGDVDSHGAE